MAGDRKQALLVDHRDVEALPLAADIDAGPAPSVISALRAHSQVLADARWVGRGRTEERRGEAMATCDVCGNEYDKTFEVTREGESGTYDSFECAIHAMAPTCQHCGCKVIGHGVEADGSI